MFELLKYMWAGWSIKEIAVAVGLSALITMFMAIRYFIIHKDKHFGAAGGAVLAALFCFFLVIWAIAIIVFNVL